MLSEIIHSHLLSNVTKLSHSLANAVQLLLTVEIKTVICLQKDLACCSYLPIILGSYLDQRIRKDLKSQKA